MSSSRDPRGSGLKIVLDLCRAPKLPYVKGCPWSFPRIPKSDKTAESSGTGTSTDCQSERKSEPPSVNSPLAFGKSSSICTGNSLVTCEIFTER